MIVDNKVYNYWNGDIYSEVESLNSNSQIVSFIEDGDLSLEQVEKNLLKEKELITNIEKKEEKLIVTAKKDDTQINIELLINKNHQLVGGEIMTTLKIKRSNNGVSSDILKKCLKTPKVLVSIAKFDVEKPFISYYLQYKVLCTAYDYGFIYDMPARKLFPKEYEEYINTIDSELLINNIYSILISKNGIATTTGLRRFNLKDLEMYNVMSPNEVYTLFRKINDNRLIKGEIKKDILINYGGEQYFTVMTLQDAIDNFSDKYILKPKSSTKIKDHLVVVPFATESIDINNLEKSIDFNGFIKSGLNFETSDYLVHKIMLARQTLPFLFEFLKAENNFRLLVEFEIVTNDKEEYVYASIESIKENDFTGYLMTDSLHNSSLTKGSKVSGTLDRMLNWEVHLKNRIKVSPINAYAFKMINEMEK